MDSMTHKTISHFRIKKKLGQGGMGTVYLAEDIKLKRDVALKILAHETILSTELQTRFEREAQAVAALNHPNIVIIFEVGEHGNRSFIAMEYVEGQSLREMINSQGMPIERVIKIVCQVCDGLSHAHEEGIVHRDIKPENILLARNDRVKIADFGIAKLSASTQLTQEGIPIGTPAYMSPEQARGELIIDQRSDVFSVGVVLYELLTGKRPFNGENYYVVLDGIRRLTPQPLVSHKPDLSEKFQKIIDNALEKEPKIRYQSVDELSRDLQEMRTQLSKQRKSVLNDKGIQQPTAVTLHVDESKNVQQQTKPPQLISTGTSQPLSQSNVQRTVTAGAENKKTANRKQIFPSTIGGFVLVILIWWIWQGMNAETGLSIKTKPSGATVFLNNDSLGLTPFNGTTSLLGKTALRLQKQDYVMIDTSIFITRDENTSYTFSLELAGMVTVRIHPENANIILDEQKINFVRLRNIGLSIGEHKIVVSKKGYDPLSEVFTLKQGLNSVLSYSLKIKSSDPPLGMVYIPAGEFLMGSNDGEDDEKPVHKVYVNDFFMDKYEVSVEKYKLFVNATSHRKPDSWDDQLRKPQRPVVNVSWDDAKTYADWTGKRLPTEAEWEYASRGGNTGVNGKRRYKYPFGNNPNVRKANYDWDNSRGDTWKITKRCLRNIGSYSANGYGLFDMAGNVYEWCADSYDTKYYEISLTRNPKGPSSGSYRVHRGGGWVNHVRDCRSAARSFSDSADGSGYIGFRLVFVP